MKVAVLSDVHDNIWNLKSLIKKLESSKIEATIFCGDLIAPSTAAILATLNTPIHCCLGNNDEDHIGMLKMGGEMINWTHLSKEFGEIVLDGRKIAFCHYPKLGELLAKSGDYDAVFYGHTHQKENKIIGKTLLVNPGAVCGFSGSNDIIPTYAIYDTRTNESTMMKINNKKE
jgi:hypothetical protein